MKWYEKSWYNIIHNKATKKAEIFLYGIIGDWDISASKFIAELKALEDVTELDIHVNSPGGDVADGIAIYNTLKEYKAEKTVIVDSVAASIASVIAMAGDKIKAYENSHLMIHRPWMMAIGNSEQLRKDADVLDMFQKAIAKSYKRDSVKSTDAEISQMMAAETWMDADKAIELGFVDEIIKTSTEEETKDVFKSRLFAQFRNVPQRIAALVNSTEIPKKEPNKLTPQKEESVKFDKDGNLVDETGKIVKTAAEIKASVLAMQASDPAANAEAVKAAQIAGQKAEKERQVNVRASGKALGVKSEIVDKAIEDGLDMSAANILFIDQAQKGLVNLTPSGEILITADEAQKFHGAAVVSMCDAAGLPAKTDEERKAVADVRKNAMPRSLHGLVRMCAARTGARGMENWTPDQIAREAQKLQNIAQGTGDFTNILTDAINKGMGIGLAEAPTTQQIWTGKKTVKDFRTYNHVKISGFSDLDVILEGAAFKYGALSDAKETGSVTTKGKKYTLSRQAIINDDMGFVSTIPRAIGNSVSRKQNRDVYDLLTSASLVGPTMTEDSVALFNASSHANYVAHGSGGAPSNTTIGVGALALSKMPLKAPDQASGTQYANISPRFIISPRALKSTIDQIVRTPFNSVATYPAGMYNPYGPGGDEQLTPVYDAYLDSINSPGWYLAGDPNQVDTIIMLTLLGNEAPTFRSENSRIGEALGITWDIYFDWGVMVGDWRGLYFNDGN